jgi:hypothetical protein
VLVGVVLLIIVDMIDCIVDMIDCIVDMIDCIVDMIDWGRAINLLPLDRRRGINSRLTY